MLNHFYFTILMKKILLSVTLLVVAYAIQGQTDTTLTDKKIREKALSEIQSSLELKTKAIDLTVSKLDAKVDDLDRAIKSSRSASDKADKLLERVQALEKRQTTVEENELNVYQANYQSAVINLVSMDREIKPLLLFDVTKGFFTSLTETANPMNYPGYEEWYKKFKVYVEQQKTKESQLLVLSNLITLTGDIAKGAPLTGPLAQSMFQGIGLYINSIGIKRKEMRTESEKMFVLTAKLSQFTHDKNLIDNEWQNITKELETLQTLYEATLNQNLYLLVIPKSDFQSQFTKEYDANKRGEYLQGLSQKAASLVSTKRLLSPKEWKEPIYYQEQDIQSLKLRFGRTTLRISENMSKYNDLIKKYKGDADLGAKVATLETKLKELKDLFDKTFEPSEYILSATRMYKVN